MEKQTTLAGWAGLLISGLAMVLAGCAGFDGIPRDPVRLDGDPEWERETWEQRANLPPQVSFLVRTDDLATAPDTLQQHIQIHKVGWVRSEITQAGNIQPITGSQWANARIEELQVPVRLSRHRDHDNVVQVTPLSALAPGLYTLSAGLSSAATQARFGVHWSRVDRREYAAAHCVDRYPGSTQNYRPCEEQELGIASRVLAVHLVQPEVSQPPGQPRQLIIKGVIVNTSGQAVPVPPLQARLVNQEGTIIKRWEFLADTKALAPGASTPFESRLTNPPAGASDVQVTFETLAPSVGRATGYAR